MKARVTLLLTVLLGFGIFVAGTYAEPPSGVSANVLARGTYDRFNVRSDPHGEIFNFRAHSAAPIDIVVRQHDYQPNSTTGWHVHPGPVLITVTKGKLTYYDVDDPTCTPRVAEANTATNAFVDDGHGHVVRNETGEPAQDISVITAPVGGAFRTHLPERANPNCGF